MYIASSLIDTIRSLMTILYFKTKIKLLYTYAEFMEKNYILQFATMIWCHVERLTHDGKVCSGDFQANTYVDS